MKTIFVLILSFFTFQVYAMDGATMILLSSSSSDTTDYKEECLKESKQWFAKPNPCIYITDDAKYYITKGETIEEATCGQAQSSSYREKSQELVNARVCSPSNMRLTDAQLKQMEEQKQSESIANLIACVGIFSLFGLGFAFLAWD